MRLTEAQLLAHLRLTERRAVYLLSPPPSEWERRLALSLLDDIRARNREIESKLAKLLTAEAGKPTTRT